ncbi:hypothetical protein [Pantoea agglomerans]|uniref:hypothetical protein n=1 Tax=Enterobacter agglomerans TaxID=549 RepID=UPI00277D4680|nr:hypothetical protein [Pantoea agglomerans]MDQ0435626.1 hypothetical protein [Pantoea agglomerans]
MKINQYVIWDRIDSDPLRYEKQEGDSDIYKLIMSAPPVTQKIYYAPELPPETNDLIRATLGLKETLYGVVEAATHRVTKYEAFSELFRENYKLFTIVAGYALSNVTVTGGKSITLNDVEVQAAKKLVSAILVDNLTPMAYYLHVKNLRGVN